MKNKVLLCDDEVHILRAAEIKLSRSGYQVECASDGQEALEAIQQNLPDILVTDLQMPRMDGIELCRRLRENPTTRRLPILMLTAKGFEQSHLELAAKYDVIATMSKPFSPRELVRTVESVLNGTYVPGARPVDCGQQAPNLA
jgi:two-component system alkaline phosphatase synthesis response regulator PhoP